MCVCVCVCVEKLRDRRFCIEYILYSIILKQEICVALSFLAKYIYIRSFFP